MLERKHFMPISYLAKEVFTGSFKKMRFREEKKSEDGKEAKLLVTFWPQPYCFDATDEEQKTSKEFEFSEQGICDSIVWLNENYKKNFS